ncbi:FIG00157344: hypothetical protein [Crocosphaera watsonii WH 8502]|uniref:Uncharacterized protein n=2 Tax=Crocosphaera TaxID=263510 RepID=T2IFY0_CROWT|nr:FIG00157344: hypothetical protein [Crocosphaera watsonii WH 8502]
MAHCYFLLAPQIKVKLRLHNGLKFSDRRICEKCGINHKRKIHYN